MLEEISISNLGIIDKAVLSFTSGLTVITGETGAGKTMILNGLHLLMGNRANVNMVKENSNCLTVEGIWSSLDSSVIDQAVDAGAVIEDDTLFVNRTVTSEGKSRSVIGGKSIPAGVLQNITSNFINIHGQSDQQRLKNPIEQLNALDEYCGPSIIDLKNNYVKLYREYKKKVKHVKEIKENSFTRIKELELLTNFVKEYEDLDINVDEVSELERTIHRLKNIDVIKNQVNDVKNLVNPEDPEFETIANVLNHVNDLLNKIAELDNSAEDLVSHSESMIDNFDDFVSMLDDYSENIDFEGLNDLYEAQERLTVVKAFIRRNGGNLTEIVKQKSIADAKIIELEQYNVPVEDLEKELELLEKKLVVAAKEISNLRSSKAIELTSKVNVELTGLAMQGTQFIINVDSTNPFSSTGVDTVEFLLSHNNGTARPVAKTASGGELSRIMLALEVTLASQTSNKMTFVFDEVDSGVGGETAIEIGKRLALLAKDSQVIIVTHLPQVAAFADNHLKVIKQLNNNNEITTNVTQLDEKQKVQELTRMLSGMTNSNFGEKHAVELRELAQTK